MKQAILQFATVEELKEYVRKTNPFLLEQKGRSVYGLFTDIERELALKGYGAREVAIPLN